MKFPYTSLGRVRKTFNLSNEWLIECTDSCACGPDCATRVVQVVLLCFFYSEIFLNLNNFCKLYIFNKFYFFSAVGKFQF